MPAAVRRSWGAALWQVVAATFVVSALYGVIGVGIGALVRHQVPAVVGVLVWLLVVDQLLVAELPTLGRWTPEGAAFGLLQLGPAATREGTLLTPLTAGLVLLGYALATSAAAAISLQRRDAL